MEVRSIPARLATVAALAAASGCRDGGRAVLADPPARLFTTEIEPPPRLPPTTVEMPIVVATRSGSRWRVTPC